MTDTEAVVRGILLGVGSVTLCAIAAVGIVLLMLACVRAFKRVI